jgi:hypothetical protein
VKHSPADQPDELPKQASSSTSPLESLVSRREFLIHAGKLGSGMAIVGSGISVFRLPFAQDSSAPPSTNADTAIEHFYSGLRWRMLGPFRGGRVAAATGVPGRPAEFYFGSVNGGVWKTIDAGRVWLPVFDSQPVASIGAIAVAPSAPDTIYVGSGESTLRDSAGFGNGMYKSTDAGRTWTHIGLEDTQHIGKIAVDPRNANNVFVAAIGHLYAANDQRGVFRSTDGGKTWKKVLYKNENVGAVEVVIDPTDSRVIYAGLWNTRRPPWFTYAPTNGPGGGDRAHRDRCFSDEPAACLCGGGLPHPRGAANCRAAAGYARTCTNWWRSHGRECSSGTGRVFSFR